MRCGGPSSTPTRMAASRPESLPRVVLGANHHLNQSLERHPVLRSDVLQAFIDLSDSKAYLEVGVEGGGTFHAIRASKKVAVDPIFRFDVPSPRLTSAVEYHEIISDEYFGKTKLSEKFDVIYLDGLHTVEQTLRDLLNAVERLQPDGVIVIDDVLPTSWAASLDLQGDAAFVRDLLSSERWDGDNWMGPVFRLVFFIETFMQSFDFATLQDNHGQLVMWRSVRETVSNPELTVERIARIEFLEVLKDKGPLRLMPHSDVVKLYRAAVGK